MHNGKVLGTAGSGVIRAMLVEPSGAILAGGDDGTLAAQKVWKLTASGSPDTEFHAAGTITANAGASVYGWALTSGPTQRVVVAGSYNGAAALAAFAPASLRLYAQHDANYDVTALADANGTVQERFAYDPYGSVQVLSPQWQPQAEAFGAEYLFQGMRLDPATGLYHTPNREYSPTLGRWMQMDPAGYVDGNNQYLLETGNPGYSDPTGLDTILTGHVSTGTPGTYSTNLDDPHSPTVFTPDQPVTPQQNAALSAAFQAAQNNPATGGRISAAELAALPITAGQAPKILEQARMLVRTPMWTKDMITCDRSWPEMRAKYPGMTDNQIAAADTDAGNIMYARIAVGKSLNPSMRAYFATLAPTLTLITMAGEIPMTAAMTLSSEGSSASIGELALGGSGDLESAASMSNLASAVASSENEVGFTPAEGLSLLADAPAQARSAAETLAASLGDGYDPRAVSAAYSPATRTYYFGYSGSSITPLPNTISEVLAERMDFLSLERWPIQNCAEFESVNGALLDGEELQDLFVATFRRKRSSVAPFPRCRNCQITVEGANIVTDPAAWDLHL